VFFAVPGRWLGGLEANKEFYQELETPAVWDMYRGGTLFKSPSDSNDDRVLFQ
jgi:hypothetical protein